MAEPQAIVDMLAHVWNQVAAVCGGLDDTSWSLPTECPGWSVQDHVSHLIGTESALLGRPQPPRVPASSGHVHNPIGERNEVWVDERRSWPPAQVRDEFHDVTAARLGALRAMSPQEFAADSWTPLGPGTYADFMAIRVLDCWVHEQDIRRAIGQPGDLDSAAARHTVARLLRAMPAVVAKRAGAPDGAIVVFNVSGPAGSIFPIEMRSGRAVLAESTPATPTLTLGLSVETFVRLACGRGDPAVVGAEVDMEGDPALGEAIVRSMNVTM